MTWRGRKKPMNRDGAGTVAGQSRLLQVLRREFRLPIPHLAACRVITKNGRRQSSPDEELRRALNGCEVLFEMGEVLHV